MMNEDEMRDKVLQELMSTMDDMSARKPEMKEAMVVAAKQPKIMNKDQKTQLEELEKETAAPSPSSTPPNSKENTEGKESAMAEEANPNEAEPDSDEDDLGFKGFVKMKRRG